MRTIIIAVLAMYSICLVVVACLHLAYPYELEWNEGGILCHAMMVARGHRLYVPPNADFFPFTYTPLYYYVVAAASLIFGMHFWVGRFISCVSTLIVAWLLYRIGAREEGERGGGGVAAGLFLSAYGFTGFWYDLCRMDSLACALLLGSLYLIRFHMVMGSVAAALLFMLAVLTKQNLIVLLPFTCAGALLIGVRRGLVFISTVCVALLITVSGYTRSTEGWFLNYTLGAPLSHGIAWSDAIHPTYAFLILKLPLIVAAACAVLGGVVASAGMGNVVRGRAFWLINLLGAILAYYITTGHPGAYKNIAIPIVLIGSILAGFVWVESKKWYGRWGSAGRAVLLLLVALQLWIFRYDPRTVIPKREDYMAGERLMRRLREIRGDILMYYHPFYPVMIGGKPTFHADAIFDRYARGERARLSQGLPPDLVSRVEGKRYAAIVLDHRAHLLDIPQLGDMIDRNYILAERLFPEGTEQFCPKTGWSIRPDFLYLPRGAGSEELRRQWPVVAGSNKFGFIRIMDYIARGGAVECPPPGKKLGPVIIPGGEMRTAIMTGSERIDDEEYRVLYNFPGYGLMIPDLTIPPNGKLVLGIGLWKQIAEKIQRGFTFKVSLTDGSGRKSELLSERFDPMRVSELHTVRWLEVDLGAWANKKVDCVFRVDPVHKADRLVDWPIWVDPCIVYPSKVKEGTSAQREKVNAIIVVVDALRPDHLPPYGYARDTAPSLSELSHDGCVCLNAYSQAPWTKPAIGSIFTGLYPYEHGALLAVDVPEYRDFPQLAFLSDELTTVAEIFRSNGYKTAGFSSNVHILRRLGFAQGFDFWQETEGLSSIEMTKDLLRWVDRNKDSPFFIYVHTMDTHSPYEALPQYRGIFRGPPPGAADRPLSEKDRSFLREGRIDDRSLRSLADLLNRYDECVYQADAQLGKLRDALREWGIGDSTFLIVTADHGEALSEHGNYFHGWTLYNEMLRVPLVLHCPRLIPPGMRIASLVESRAIAGTLVDMLELAVPAKEKEAFSQQSVRNLVSSPQPGSNATAYSETEVTMVKSPPALRSAISCVQDRDWKCVYDARAGAHQLYHLPLDPGETSNVYDANVHIAERYRRILEQRGRVVEHPPAAAEKMTGGETSEIVRERLRTLGYVK